ncbi:MAG: ECF-type sigma factor [Acidobacteriota bacterium]
MADDTEDTKPLHITRLLTEWKAGSKDAHDELYESVYKSLERIARSRLRRERSKLLSTGELVHEAYIKLLETQDLDWERRAQFYGIASEVMRRILVDHARARNVRERKAVLLAEPEGASDRRTDVLAIEAALRKLEADGDTLEAHVVQLRFFAGMSIAETAAELGIGHATVERIWARARTRLGEILGVDRSGPAA